MEVISGIIATVDGGAILAFAGWLIRRHFHRDEASQQTGPSETAQTRPVQHLQDRQSDNAHAGAHAGANSLPQTMSQKDHADYRQLLQLYESNLNLLEDLIITRSQLEAGPDEWNLVLDQQFARTRDGIYQNLEQPMGIFNKLDILQRHS